MKIAFVNQPWTIAAPARGGDSIGIWTYQVARRLASRAEITVYGCKHSRYSSTDYIEEGIRYRGISSKIDKLLLPFWQKLDRWEISSAKRPIYTSELYYRNYFVKVARELSSQQIDIIHIHSFFSYLPIFRRLNPNAKIILHMHCEWLSLLDRKMVENYIVNADRIIGCSEFISERIRQKFPQLADRTQTVFNGVDTNYFVGNEIYRDNHDRDKQNILYVGRISPEKGIHDLIDSFKEVVKHYPGVILNLVGGETNAAKEFVIRINDDPLVTELISFFPGSYLEKLKNRIPPNLSDRINFVGNIEQEKLLKYYWDADILVNPSLSEAFGMSLAEAMATNLPVIGTRVGGMTSVIEEGKTGLLVEPANPSALAKAILELLGDRERRQEIGIEGHLRANKLFSWDKIAEDIFSCYKVVGIADFGDNLSQVS
jgi:glycosyltransferase involved in cell wall biosynthesis